MILALRTAEVWLMHCLWTLVHINVVADVALGGKIVVCFAMAGEPSIGNVRR